MYLHGLQFYSEQRKLTRIGLAEAPLDDPLDWRMVSEEPLIDLGGERATDSHMAAYPWVTRITDTHWHLYYAAWDARSSRMPRTRSATRPAWPKATTPASRGGATAGRCWRWDAAAPPTRTAPAPARCSRSATSTGCTTRRCRCRPPTGGGSPPRSPSPATAATPSSRTLRGALLNIPPRIGHLASTCSKPFVERSGDLFHMWFSRAVDGEHYRVHYAESADGIHFKWLPDPRRRRERIRLGLADDLLPVGDPPRRPGRKPARSCSTPATTTPASAPPNS